MVGSCEEEQQLEKIKTVPHREGAGLSEWWGLGGICFREENPSPQDFKELIDAHAGLRGDEVKICPCPHKCVYVRVIYISV